MSLAKSAALAFFALSLLSLPARAADVDKLLPDDSSVVVFVDVGQILNSEFVKKQDLTQVKKALKGNEGVDQILTKAGFDPLKDLATMTMALEGDLVGNKGLVILRGKFNSARIAAAAEDFAKKNDQFKVEAIAGQNVYVMYGGPSGAAGPGYLAVLDATTAIATSDKAALEEALAKQAGKKKAAVNKDLKRHVEAIEVGSSLWIVARGESIRKNPLAADDKVKEVLDRIAFATFAATVKDGVSLKASVNATGDDAAKALTKDIEGGLESARGVIALVADNRPELKPVGEFLDSLKLKSEGTTLRLEGNLSGSVIEKLMKARK